MNTNTTIFCTIKQDDTIDILALPCKHQFDRWEIMKWLTRSDTCPLCKQRVDKEELASSYTWRWIRFQMQAGTAFETVRAIGSLPLAVYAVAFCVLCTAACYSPNCRDRIRAIHMIFSLTARSFCPLSINLFINLFRLLRGDTPPVTPMRIQLNRAGATLSKYGDIAIATGLASGTLQVTSAGAAISLAGTGLKSLSRCQTVHHLALIASYAAMYTYIYTYLLFGINLLSAQSENGGR